MKDEDKKTILIVEDEAIIAMLEKKQLEIKGYKVHHVSTGEDAIKTIVDNALSVDLILMDIDLGTGIDGTQTAEQILKVKDIPVVFLSSHTEPEVVEKTEKISSYGYVVKNSGFVVLDASIKMAFKLFDAKIAHKQKEEDLRKSEYKYRLLFENMNVSFAVHEAIYDDNGNLVDYRFLDMNPMFLNNLGCTASAVRGHTAKELFPNTEQYWFNIFGEVAKTGKPVAFQNYSRELDQWFNTFVYSPEKNQFASFFIDITEQKKMAEAHKESEARFRIAQEMSPDGFTIFHPVRNEKEEIIDFTWRYENSSIARINGTDPQKVIGKQLLHLFPNHRNTPVFEAYVHVANSGETMVIDELLVEDILAKPTWLRLVLVSMGTDIAILAQDITERKELESQRHAEEENLRITLNSIGDAVISTDNQGRVARMNPVAEMLCGWKEADAYGKKLEEVFSIVNAGTRKRVDNPVDTVMLTGTVVGLANHTMLLSKDGKEYQIADSAAPITTSEGDITGVVLVFRDVTEEYEKDRQLKENLHTFEWMLSGKKDKKKNYMPGYGDLTDLNKNGLILSSLGKDQLTQISSEYLDLLETSSAVYEKNGDYALGMFSSGWCQLLDAASRKLCRSDDNKEALSCGKWLCHESCWRDASLKSIESARPVDVECAGGLRLYAIPVRANGEVIGAINFGYGTPTKDDIKLQKLSNLFQVPLELLRKKREEYQTRPQFIIDYAKKRIEISAKLIGNLIERKQAEEEIEKQLAEKEILLREVNHRVKNNVASIESFLLLQDDLTDNLEAKSVIKDAISRVQSTRILYDKLLVSKDIREISIKNYTEDLIDSLYNVFVEKNNLVIEKNISDFNILSEQAITIGIIMNELLTNVFKYAFKGRDKGTISISIQKNENRVTLSLQDNGMGIDERIMENQSPGFGLTIVKMLVEQLKGTYSVVNENGTRSLIQFEI